VARAAAGLAAGVGLGDAVIAMSTHPEFEERYLLRGQDEIALRRLFSDRVLRFFSENQGWMIESDGKRLMLDRLSPAEIRTYWQGAIAPNEAREIGAAISAARDGTLGAKLHASPGVPPAELRSFLTTALDAAAQFRTS
jgi:hypothetical protein